MPDYVLFAKGVLGSAIVAGLVLLFAARLGQGPRAWLLKTGWIVALGAGIYAGCGVLGLWSRWSVVRRWP